MRCEDDQQSDLISYDSVHRPRNVRGQKKKHLGGSVVGFSSATIAAFAVSIIMSLAANAQEIKSDSQQSRPSDETSWYINNIVSTSTETPAAAIRLPLEQTVPISGTIFDVDGAPAVDAEVWAASVFAEPPYRERVLTDDRGRFLLYLKPLRGRSERWSLSAHKGSSSAKIEGSLAWIKEADPKQPKMLSARLIHRGQMRCRILADETEQPIRDARLFLGDGRVFISNAEGVIEIGGLEQGNHRTVVVAKGRERKRFLFDNTLRPDGKLNLFLKHAGQVTGTVVDQDGQPVPFAWIKVSGSGRALTLDGRCAIANSKGEFVWDGVATDRVLRSLSAGCEGFESAQLNNLSVARGKPQKVVFRLQRLPAGSGKGSEIIPRPDRLPGDSATTSTLARRDLSGVVSGPDGNPIQKALVRWGATAYEDVDRRQTTDSDGRFDLKGVPDRDGFVTVIADSFAPAFIRVDQSQSDLSVKLMPGQKVGGRVIDQFGSPIPNVKIVPVIASPDPSLCNPYWIDQRSARTDDEGRFMIEALPVSGFALDFMPENQSELRNKFLQAGKTDHVVQLPTKGGFRGRVVDPNGRPVENFRVTIDFPREKQPNDLQKGFGVVYRSIGNSYSDDEGRFAWGDEVFPGAVYRVTVTAKGYGKAVLDRVVTPGFDRLVDSKEFVFNLTEPHSLSVAVLDARDDKPVAGARVTLIDSRPTLDDSGFTWGSDEIGWPIRVTNRDGVANLNQLTTDQGTIAIEALGYEFKRFGWRRNEKAFAVRLIPEATIAGTIKTSAGIPLQDINLSLEGPDQTYHWTQLANDALGEFRFPSLSGGTYTMTVRDERRTLFETEIKVRSGQTFTIGLTLDTNSGKVIAAKRARSGEPIADNVRSEITSE